VAAMSLSPSELYERIKMTYPEFRIEYEPDFRQKIADSWPRSIDDTQARSDWGWKHEFDLQKMAKDMIRHLKNSELITSP
jgi:nucleoside-diphosphate-sugar epimerase